jgi:hypothetical protein
MQRSRISLFILGVLVVILALPAIARADETPDYASSKSVTATAEPVPDGWTWDEAVTPESVPDGWTWDEATTPESIPDGWTWDEAVTPEPVPDGWTWDEALPAPEVVSDAETDGASSESPSP